ELRAERDQRVAALAAALSQRVAWDRILRQISSILPEDVWLTSIDAQSPTADAASSTPAPTTTTSTDTTSTSTDTTATPPPPPPRLAILTLVGLVVAIVAGYGALLAPQRSKAAGLSAQIASARGRIDAADAAGSAAQSDVAPIRVADLFRLSRAMPDTPDLPD